MYLKASTASLAVIAAISADESVHGKSQPYFRQLESNTKKSDLPYVKTLKIRQKKGPNRGVERFFCLKRIPLSNIGDLNSTEKCLKTVIPFVLFSVFI